jgi:hypothetical protein
MPHNQPQDTNQAVSRHRQQCTLSADCMGHCLTHSVHTINFCFRLALKLYNPLDGISVCSICISSCPPSVESQLLTSEDMGYNKILLTLWAELHSTTYKRLPKSKPLCHYTVTLSPDAVPDMEINQCCSTCTTQHLLPCQTAYYEEWSHKKMATVLLTQFYFPSIPHQFLYH